MVLAAKCVVRMVFRQTTVKKVHTHTFGSFWNGESFSRLKWMWLQGNRGKTSHFHRLISRCLRGIDKTKTKIHLNCFGRSSNSSRPKMLSSLAWAHNMWPHWQQQKNTHKNVIWRAHEHQHIDTSAQKMNYKKKNAKVNIWWASAAIQH